MDLSSIMPYFLLAQKLFFVACAILYFIFSLIIVKQVTSMSKNVHDKFNPFLISFSFIHLIFSAVLIFLVVVLL
jgi:hypothetical protein